MGNDISTDAMGNVYIVGWFSCTTTFGNITINPSTGQPYTTFVAKFDANGNALWARSSWSSTFGNQEGMVIIADAAGNCYITGTYEVPSVSFGNCTLTGGSHALYIFS